MSFEEKLSDYILWGFLASAGGVARYLSSSIDPKSPSVTTRRFITLLGANVFVSGFSGLMGALMMSIITPEHTWHTVSAGVFGFMGAKGLEVLAEKISKKL